jgi:hypothetical protein
MGDSILRVAARTLLAKKPLNLSLYGLEGLTTGQPTTLYHGTTKLFRVFDMNRSRDELVNKFYGRGIFLTPSKRVASKYADANRNIGFDVDIIEDLKKKNPNAGKFLQAVYDKGPDGWEHFMEENGFLRENPPPGEGRLDIEGFQKFLGVDPNSLGDLAGYILGSKTKPVSMGGDNTLDLLMNTGTGAPSWIYDNLDEVGLDSKTYRPKIYTVVATVENTLVTASKPEARKARSKGYDCVVFHGSDLVDGVPEVAIFDSKKVKVRKIEVID